MTTTVSISTIWIKTKVVRVGVKYNGIEIDMEGESNKLAEMEERCEMADEATVR